MHQKGKRILSFCGGVWVLNEKRLSWWIYNKQFKPRVPAVPYCDFCDPLIRHFSKKKVPHTIIPSPPVSGLMAVYLRKGLGVHLLFKLNHLSDGLFRDWPIPLAMLQSTGLLSQSFKTFGFFLLRACVLFVFSILDWTERKERRLFKVWFID